MNVASKVVLITGAARGLGLEYARSLGEAGARIVAGDIADCAAAVTAAGNDAIGVTLDVTDIASADSMVELAMERFGRIDALINNAALYGALRGGRFNQIAETDWDAAMAVNVKGIWNCCKAVVPAMRQSGGGSIVNVASLAATYGMPFALHYTTSKAAVIGLTRGLARELGRDNIRVNALAPSAVMTEGTVEFLGDKLDRGLEVIRAGQSTPRTLEPADLTGTVAWLISDGSRFCHRADDCGGWGNRDALIGPGKPQSQPVDCP
jgi:NAD(P)-dependent dehydrogenase (short-subunit alcohol dehydrogenase family)